MKLVYRYDYDFEAWIFVCIRNPHYDNSFGSTYLDICEVYPEHFRSEVLH